MKRRSQKMRQNTGMATRWRISCRICAISCGLGGAQTVEVIKYEGDNSTFIWKHPCEDFNSLTQLIVHESQEAIFFMNGQALDLFGARRYTLETQNIPKIGKFLHRETGDTTPFHCEV